MTVTIEEYYKAIKNQKSNNLKKLLKNDKYTKRDMLMVMYDKGWLKYTDLIYLMEKFSNEIEITTQFIDLLINANDAKFLYVIFSNIKLFDNEFILYLLFHYKKKTPLSTSTLKEKISNYEIKCCPCYQKSNIKKTCYSIKSCSFLHQACSEGNLFAVKFLYNHGMDIRSKGCKYMSPLAHSFEHGQLEIAKYLIKHGANINETVDEKNNYPLLHYLYKTNKINNLKYLIECGADINIKGENGSTVLHLACEKNDKETAEYLVNHGANINEKKSNRYTPLHLACENLNLNLIKYLVEHGGDINGKERFERTPLHEVLGASYSNHTYFNFINVIEYLLNLGADINKRDEHGETPLHIAIYACKKNGKDLDTKLRVIKYLFDHGADKNKINFFGKKPLSLFTDKEHFIRSETLKFLIENGIID